MITRPTTFLTDLPVDILINIFTYLSPENIALLALLQKNFNDLVNNKFDQLWQDKCVKHFPYVTFSQTTNFYEKFKHAYLEGYQSVDLPLRPLFSIVKEGDYLRWQEIELMNISHYINKVDRDGYSLLGHAQKSKDEKMLGHIYRVAKNSYLKANFYYLDKRRNNIDAQIVVKNKTILYWALACHQSLSEIASLLALGANPDRICESGLQFYPLHVVAHQGSSEIFDYLLQLTPHRLNQVDRCNQSPLLLACSNGYKDIVELLLGQPNINLLTFSNSPDERDLQYQGWTALHWAAMRGFDETVKLLLEYDNNNPSFSDKMLEEVYLSAAKIGRLNVVNVFLDCKPGLLNVMDDKHQTALILACAEGQVHVVNYLLKKTGIDLYMATKDVLGKHQGWTVLHWAAFKGYISIIRQLIKQETLADMLKYVKDGFFLGCEAGRLDVVKVFLQYIPKLINEASSNNKTALMLACEMGYLHIVRFLLEDADIDLSAIIQDNSSKYHGWTALHFAACKGCNNIVDLILTKSYEHLSIKLPTIKLSLRMDVQGKLELIEYISHGAYTNSLFGQNPMEKRKSAALLKNLVFFQGDKKCYEQLLSSFKSMHVSSIGDSTLGKIYKKLEVFLEGKINALPELQNNLLERQINRGVN